MRIARFKGQMCKVLFEHYANNNRHCISLVSNDIRNLLVKVATVNIHDAIIDDQHEVIINTNANNKGMFHSLFSAGIISSPITYRISDDCVRHPVCLLLIDPFEESIDLPIGLPGGV